MLAARTKGAEARAAAAQRAAQAEVLHKDSTTVDEDGVKWRTRADGTR